MTSPFKTREELQELACRSICFAKGIDPDKVVTRLEFVGEAGPTDFLNWHRFQGTPDADLIVAMLKAASILAEIDS